MRRTSLLRLFWLGAAAVLTIAALVALVAVLGGSFDETDAKILGVLGTALLAGGVATAGASLRETRLAPALGLANLIVAPVAFVVATAAIADGFRSHGLARVAWSAYVLLATALVVGSARTLARRSQLVLFGATTAFSVLGGLVVVGAIWSAHAGSGYAKGATACWIVAALGYLLIPVSRRASGSEIESVRAVDLADGVTFAGLHVGLADRGTMSDGREALYVVLDGRARVSGVELERGAAALAPSGAALELLPNARVLRIRR